jgi:putative flavoprotein involved in K+ transport
VPGLYFLGLPWQHTRGSALLGFVGDDAAHVVRAAQRHRDAASIAGTITHPVQH